MCVGTRRRYVRFTIGGTFVLLVLLRISLAFPLSLSLLNGSAYIYPCQPNTLYPDYFPFVTYTCPPSQLLPGACCRCPNLNLRWLLLPRKHQQPPHTTTTATTYISLLELFVGLQQPRHSQRLFLILLVLLAFASHQQRQAGPGLSGHQPGLDGGLAPVTDGDQEEPGQQRGHVADDSAKEAGSEAADGGQPAGNLLLLDMPSCLPCITHKCADDAAMKTLHSYALKPEKKTMREPEICILQLRALQSLPYTFNVNMRYITHTQAGGTLEILYEHPKEDSVSILSSEDGTAYGLYAAAAAAAAEAERLNDLDMRKDTLQSWQQLDEEIR